MEKKQHSFSSSLPLISVTSSLDSISSFCFAQVLGCLIETLALPSFCLILLLGKLVFGLFLHVDTFLVLFLRKLRLFMLQMTFLLPSTNHFIFS